MEFALLIASADDEEIFKWRVLMHILWFSDSNLMCKFLFGDGA
jgi:hypothetical protein